ncbi:glycosyltransferase family 2 protein [Methanomassiliicoccus luminyensis]|jgi:glycosyltransferase involved in cell wall biosynthesis|uniref:glycosyltransferase family 2 protein n=1 Tax=Methanomassiliicoccus luminyensis TaxID=1080712 RepID=UPI00037B9FC8|nr:glycosyltransferase [Methanomassiliicoccus luminyensis]
MTDGLPLVSVIIPSYNPGESLETCLRSIREQSYENIEIIVVDRNSTDGTPGVAGNNSARLMLIDCERAEAKNHGINLAQGKYIAFIDSDMELTSSVISECVSICERSIQVGGIIIPERSVGNSYWVKVRDHERKYYAGTEIESARFFPRDLAERAKGFETGVIFFEESTLPQKIKLMGFSISARIASPILHHEDNFTLGHWLRKKYYYGKTAKAYRAKYGDYGAAQMSVRKRFSIFLMQGNFYKRPALAIGVLTLKALEFVSAGLGYMSKQRPDYDDSAVDI